LGYARDIKSYKKDPSIYKGHVGDVAAVLRFALTSCTNTPDLCEIMQIMGKERVIRRLERAYSKFR
jgi:glutamyl-tRNA synthetase